jgi:hypothetical protein
MGRPFIPFSAAPTGPKNMPADSDGLACFFDIPFFPFLLLLSFPLFCACQYHVQNPYWGRVGRDIFIIICPVGRLVGRGAGMEGGLFTMIVTVGVAVGVVVVVIVGDSEVS